MGERLPIGIYVQSTDNVLNAVSGVVSFPKDKLEVASVSKQKSIITFWVQGPSFLNNAGTISFEGIVFNPGYRGERGEIVTINFKVKKEGEATLKFSSGSALANDGLGTNILKDLGVAKFSFIAPLSPIPEVTDVPEIINENVPTDVPLESNINSYEQPTQKKINFEDLLGTELLKFVLLILLITLLILLVLLALKKSYNKAPNIHSIFEALKVTMKKEIIVFEKMRSIPEIVAEEKKVLNTLSKEIDKTEELVKREIEGINSTPK